MAQPVKQFYTPAEYLTWEEAAPYKSEYRNGQIVMMSGASDAHNLISFNVGGQLYLAFQKKACRGYTGDMKVWVEKENLYTYPDIIIVCDKPLFVPKRNDIITNPNVIMEILSDSTKSYDEGDKFDSYSTLESLQHYVLIDQKRCAIRNYQRQADQSWLLRRYTQLNEVLRLPAVDLELPLARIYEGVELINIKVNQSGQEPG